MQAWMLHSGWLVTWSGYVPSVLTFPTNYWWHCGPVRRSAASDLWVTDFHPDLWLCLCRLCIFSLWQYGFFHVYKWMEELRGNYANALKEKKSGKPDCSENWHRRWTEMASFPVCLMMSLIAKWPWGRACSWTWICQQLKRRNISVHVEYWYAAM